MDRTEIAAILNIPVGEVISIVETAVNKIRVALKLEPIANPDPDPDEWVNATQAAKLLSCDRKWVYTLCKLARVRHRRDARGRVFLRSDLIRERQERNRSPYAILERMKAIHDKFSSPLFRKCMLGPVSKGDVEFVRQSAELYMSEQGINLTGVRIVVVLAGEGRAMFNVEAAEGVTVTV